MVPGSDPVESLFHAVRDALSPLESGIARAAKDLESQWSKSRNEGEDMNLFGKFAAAKKKPGCYDAAAVAASAPEGKKKGTVRIPIKSFIGSLLPDSSLRSSGKDESCTNCLHFAVTWSLLFTNFLQGLPSPFKSVKKCFGKPRGQEDGSGIAVEPMHCKSSKRGYENSVSSCKREPSLEGDVLSLELILCCAFDSVLQNLHLFDLGHKESSSKGCDSDASPPRFDHMKIITGILKGKKADADGFLSNIRFARVGGVPPSLAGTMDSVDGEAGEDPPATGGEKEVSDDSVPQKIASGLLNIPLSNVERLRSTLSTVSLTELIEFIPQLGKSFSEQPEHPDKKKLFSVQDFFRYAETEGRRFFDELDRDGDGQVTLEDLEVAMGKRKLPRRYARDFLRRTRSHLFSKSIGWKQFLSLMEQKEPTILRAYTTLCLSKSGTLKKNQILISLRGAGLPANEDNAAAMMRYLNADTDGPISYSHFRNFMLLLPSDRLEDDPRNVWFEAATVVAVPPPVEISTENVLKSALAGGLASALSTSLMYPVDTIKTRVQVSTLSFPEVVSKIPEIGLNGLYRGSIPAILGQFSSHGLRTGIFEASKLVLIKVAPTLPEIQVQSLASFCSTVLGTAVRIPCEVLKQRLQAGLFDNVGEAIIGTLHKDGLKGFFRGTGATLCREVPLYVAGMGLYSETKKLTQKILDRDLEPWETIAVGALSGGLAAVITTPFDVMKTRMMTAPPGTHVSMQVVVLSILSKDGPLGLFKGAVPRFFWIAPVGAMNFAGYELAKKAMDKNEDTSAEQLSEKRMA